MKTPRLLTLSLMLGLLLVPIAASADHHEMAPKPLTWISYVMSQPGKGTDLAGNIAAEGAKIYDGLMADGHIVTWGVALPINHFAGDDWNVMEWVTFRDWAAMDAFMGAFMKMQMAKSPEQMMAEQETWKSLVVQGSHHDEIIEHLHVARSDMKPAYFELSYFPLKPFQGESLKDLWLEYGQQTMDGLQTAGTIGAYGLGVTAVHDGVTPPSALFWTALPNLAAKGAVDAAFEAADKARGEEATNKMMESFGSKVGLDGHHDRILLVTHNGGGGEPGGDG